MSRHPFSTKSKSSTDELTVICRFDCSGNAFSQEVEWSYKYGILWTLSADELTQLCLVSRCLIESEDVLGFKICCVIYQQIYILNIKLTFCRCDVKFLSRCEEFYNVSICVNSQLEIFIVLESDMSAEIFNNQHS